IAAGAASVTTRNNIFSSNGVTGSLGYGLNDANNKIVSISNNSYFGNFTAACTGTACNGANALTTDPQLADPTANNFSIVCGGPSVDSALDYGQSWGTPPYDRGAIEGCVTVYSINGTVFIDEDYTSTTGYSVATDTELSNVTVELYDNTGTYIKSTTTTTGAYSFTGVNDGETYSVRVLSSSVAGATEKSYGAALADATWINGVTKFGGQDPQADDTDTATQAGIGDTYATVTLSGGAVNNVDFGFAYNLISNTNDSGQGSLRQYILNANTGNLSGADLTSQFRIPTSDTNKQGSTPNEWYRIVPLTELPTITTDNVILDATTQAAINAAGPEIELWGDGDAGSIASGIAINAASNVSVKGFAINNVGAVGAYGVYVTGAANANKIIGNYIGQSPIGVATSGNRAGVGIIDGPTNTEIGGVGAGEGNVISGNRAGSVIDNHGIYINGNSTTVSGTLIRGNLIGTDPTGTLSRPNYYGIRIEATVFAVTNTIIGGTTAAARNIVAGNDQFGIFAKGTTNGIVIQGNSIGTGATGTETGLGNTGKGIYLFNNTDLNPTFTVGGENANEGNIIRWNTGTGVDVNGYSNIPVNPDDLRISGNIISDISSGHGINTTNTKGVIITRNIIANASNAGIQMSGAASNLIYHNTIYNHGTHGIEVQLASSNIDIQNNIITNNGQWGLFENGDFITTFNNNSYFANTSGVCSGTNCAVETARLTTNPLLFDPASGDYSLVCTSSAIDSAASPITYTQTWTALDDASEVNDPSTFDRGAVEATCKTAGTGSISGTVFNDANFNGTASAFGAGDGLLGGVDVELYNNSNAYQASTTTSSGAYSFSGLVDGTYKVRIRTATINGGSGVPELAWANGAAAYGGQDPAVDDTATGDNAGIGDTYTSVTVAGGGAVSNVDFGFAYNLIVNTNDSGQGSLRQFMLNANTAALLVATNKTSQFRMQVATNQINGSDTWWRITPTSELPQLTNIANSIVLDASTQATNSGSDSNTKGPEIEINGASCTTCDGIYLLDATGVNVKGFNINSFDLRGINIGASATGTVIQGNYIGTDAIGSNDLGNTSYGIRVGANDTTIGGTSAGEGNLVSGNNDWQIYLTSVNNFVIQGNYIGTNYLANAVLTNDVLKTGIYNSGSNGVIGGSAAGARNIISGNDNGIGSMNAITDLTVQGNYFGTDITGTLSIPNRRDISLLSSAASSTIKIGGTAAGEGNLMANASFDYAILIDVLDGTNEISSNVIRNSNNSNIYV
ncbi:MAG: right-handed parallel beta-helix repeat-containing protein, partial [Gammaproteobacteria bacterium]|nr:right-handed parallel beta-helix repeat-containing protein [Gammaproteobacteria bacterium]